MISDGQVKSIVRERYAETARQADRGAAGKGCCGPSSIYAPLELEGLPNTVLAASAGCGNPTALASIRQGEVVLDLGSGGGIDCFLAARAVGKRGRVLGVDMTLDMVRLAKSNAGRIGASNAEFLLAELESLPLKANAVDIIISNCVINLSPDKDSVFAEGFRVLRPGGRLHVSDIMLEQELPGSVRADPEALVACVAGADLKDIYLERMRRAGFTEITVTEAGSLGIEGASYPGVISAKLEAKKPAS